MTDGFNNHDPVASKRMYTADADFTKVAGMQAKGAAEIEKFLASGLKTIN
jgi:ketosteroid isomerase-like protein